MKSRVYELYLKIKLQAGLLTHRGLHWKNLKNRTCIKLYAGNIPDMKEYEDKNIVGLSISHHDKRTIFHDITKKFQIGDSRVDSFQAEEVLEHIPYEKIPDILEEVYRVLKPGGICRISVPDYNSPGLKKRSLYDYEGKLVFDPIGGGVYSNEGVEFGGHIWFPTYENVKELVEISPFNNAKFYMYYDGDDLIQEEIDLSVGYIHRLYSEYHISNRVTSIIVDLVK